MSNRIKIPPDDRYNKELVDNVHPSDWKDPEPAKMYNLVVLGAGPAGLVAAAGAAGLGAKVALIEKHLMGGDCLNVGCVPSKSLIKAARTANTNNESGDYVKDNACFKSAMERLRKIRAGIAHHDSAERFTDLGIDVFLGHGSFKDSTTATVNGLDLNFKKAVIATGASASIPNIDGLDNAGYLTNETIFELTELPNHLVVLGGGPIGSELAQAFRLLGSEVTMLVRSQLVSKEETEASEVLTDIFRSEGIDVRTGASIKSIDSNRELKTISILQDNRESSISCNQLLVAVGRTPNTNDLGLESAGVEYDARTGVIVDDRLRTSNPNVYAAGDICMRHKFTHAADGAARIVIQNALFKGRKKLSSLIIPKCTYTSPEIASVGATEKELIEWQIGYDTYKVDVSELDRAQTDSETDGFIKILTRKSSDSILGATIVSSHAGELIGEITTAMTNGLGLSHLGNVIHPYPTQAEIVKRAADAYNRTRLSPKIKKLFKIWFDWNLR